MCLFRDWGVCWVLSIGFELLELSMGWLVPQVRVVYDVIRAAWVYLRCGGCGGGLGGGGAGFRIQAFAAYHAVSFETHCLFSCSLFVLRFRFIILAGGDGGSGVAHVAWLRYCFFLPCLACVMFVQFSRPHDSCHSFCISLHLLFSARAVWFGSLAELRST